ncbi:MAG TPA: hypothetical protein H9673_04255 [Candidatus Adamsella sp.]|nr:hypothetical protein [Candidatus Adamsella sp.]
MILGNNKLHLLIKNKNILIYLSLITIFLLLTISFLLEITDLDLVVLPFGIYFLITIFLFAVLNYFVNDKFVSKIFLLSILFHFIFILFWHIFKYYLLGYNLPTNNSFTPFTIDNDGVLYHSLGSYVAKNFSLTTFSEHLTGGVFPKITGILYHFFGTNPFLPCLLNCFISGFTAIFIYLIGKNTLENKQIAKIYSVLSILTFAHVMNTSVLIRDAYITLFMYSSIYLSFLFFKSKNIFFLPLTLISLFLLYLFRPYASYILISAFFVAFILCSLKGTYKNNRIKTSKFSLILYILLPILIVTFLFILKYFLNSITLLKSISVESLIEIRETAYQTGAAEVSIDFGALYSKFFLLPFIIGYIYLFLAPFPWEWIYATRIVYVFDMLMLYFMLPSFFKNIKLVFIEKKYLLFSILLSIIFMFSIYCITLGNTGAIHRLRGPFIPMIYLIAMLKPNKLLKKFILSIINYKII